MDVTADLTYASPDDPILKRKLIRSIENLFGKKKIERLYQMIPQHHAGKASFFEEAFKILQIQVEYEARQIQKIPPTGPLVFVANHPYGVLDGMFLSYLASKSRENWGMLVYSKFCEIDHLKSNFLPVAPEEETPEAIKLTIDTKKKTMAILREGGAVIIFPAGSIAKTNHLLASPNDDEWRLFAAKLIKMTQATVVPVFFHGHNSWLFHTVSHFSETVRLALIIHELRNKIGKSIKVTIGDPIPYETLSGFKKRRALLNHLRDRTFQLASLVE